MVGHSNATITNDNGELLTGGVVMPTSISTSSQCASAIAALGLYVRSLSEGTDGDDYRKRHAGILRSGILQLLNAVAANPKIVADKSFSRDDIMNMGTKLKTVLSAAGMSDAYNNHRRCLILACIETMERKTSDTPIEDWHKRPKREVFSKVLLSLYPSHLYKAAKDIFERYNSFAVPQARITSYEKFNSTLEDRTYAGPCGKAQLFVQYFLASTKLHASKNLFDSEVPYWNLIEDYQFFYSTKDIISYLIKCLIEMSIAIKDIKRERAPKSDTAKGGLGVDHRYIIKRDSSFGQIIEYLISEITEHLSTVSKTDRKKKRGAPWGNLEEDDDNYILNKTAFIGEIEPRVRVNAPTNKQRSLGWYLMHHHNTLHTLLTAEDSKPGSKTFKERLIDGRTDFIKMLHYYRGDTMKAKDFKVRLEKRYAEQSELGTIFAVQTILMNYQKTLPDFF